MTTPGRWRLRITPNGTDPRLRQAVEVIATFVTLLLTVAVVGAIAAALHGQFCPRSTKLPAAPQQPGPGSEVYGADDCSWIDFNGTPHWTCLQVGMYSRCERIEAADGPWRCWP